MALLLALILTLTPLAIAPAWFFYFDVTPKTIVLLVGTAAATIWWAVTGGARLSRWFLLAFAGMAVSLLVSTLVSVNPRLSLGGSNWRYWGLVPQLAALTFACLVAACCAGRPKRRRTVLRAAVVSGWLTAVYGIAQYFGYDPLLDPRVYHVGEGIWAIVRPPSTLGHADYFANWLLFAFFAGVASALTDRATFWRWLARTSAAISLVAIILSGTRAALVGLAAGVLFLILWRGLRLTRGVLAAGLAIAAGGMAFYLSPAGAMLRARVHWVSEERTGGARLLLWRDTVRMAFERWPAGYGPETFAGAFAPHQSTELARSYPDFYYESPHNIILDALVSQGVPGALLLIVLCATGFAAAWKARPDASAGALAASLAAMTVGGQFACFTMPTALAYYVTIAMLNSLGPRATPQTQHRWWRIAAATPYAAGLILFSVRLAMSETALAEVRRDLSSGLLSAAAERYAACPPGGPGADLWYSRRLVQIAGSDAGREVRAEAFQSAVIAAIRATHTDDAPFNAYYNLAAVYASQNDFVHTEASLRSAILYAPSWFKPRWMLAQVLAANGRLADAEAEAARAAALDGGVHPEVAGTLEHIRATRSPVHLKH